MPFRDPAQRERAPPSRDRGPIVNDRASVPRDQAFSRSIVGATPEYRRVILMKRAGATLPSRAPPLTMPAPQLGREFQPSSEDRPPKPLSQARLDRLLRGGPVLSQTAVVSADSLFVLQSGEALSPSKR
jgi:hypothetical protein